MADVDCYGSLVGTRTRQIPLANTAQTEGSSEEVQTDSNLVGSAQSAGTYGDQLAGGFAVAAAGLVCENEISAAWIDSAGKIKMALPFGSSGLGGDELPSGVPYPKRLAAGDRVMVTANTAADREVGLSVACSNGEYHCFTVTPSGSGEHELISVLSSQSIGQTLQGRRITHAFVSGGNNNTNFTTPIYIVDGSGIPQASTFPTDTSTNSCTFAPMPCTIQLNSRAIFRTDA